MTCGTNGADCMDLLWTKRTDEARDQSNEWFPFSSFSFWWDILPCLPQSAKCLCQNYRLLKSQPPIKVISNRQKTQRFINSLFYFGFFIWVNNSEKQTPSMCRWERDGSSLCWRATFGLAARALPGTLVWGCFVSALPLFFGMAGISIVTARELRHWLHSARHELEWEHAVLGRPLTVKWFSFCL